MPTYDYECEACGNKFEKFQSMSSAPIKKCPKCGKNKVKRLIGTGAGLIFKGSGFYITDYRDKSYADAAKSESGDATKASSEKHADAAAEKSADKPSDKPADAKPAASGEKSSDSSRTSKSESSASNAPSGNSKSAASITKDSKSAKKSGK